MLLFKQVISKEEYKDHVIPIRCENFIKDIEKNLNDKILPFCGLRMRGVAKDDPTPLPKVHLTRISWHAILSIF